MNCKQSQKLLSTQDFITSDLTNDGSTGKTHDLLNQHLKTCAGCSLFLKQLRRIESILQSPAAAPATQLPSAHLKQRIETRLSEAAIENARAPWFSRPLRSLSWLKEDRKVMRRFSFSMGAAAILALCIVSMVEQSGRANTALKRMGEAARHVRTVHLIGWNCELKPSVANAVQQGEEHISFTEVMPCRIEAWISGDRWREAEDFDVTVYSRGKVWLNGQLSPGETEPPLLTSFAFKAISGEDPFGAGVPFTSGDVGEKTLEGRRMITLAMESNKPILANGEKPINERRLFWLDPDSYLPVRMEEMRWDTDRWALDAVIWFDYNIPAADTLFDPAAVKQERHGSVSWADHPARDLYRLTAEQAAKYQAITSEPDTTTEQINANAALTASQKSAMLVAHSRQFNDRLRQIMDADQRRLFDDWWYVQPKILDKLATPEQRAEEARWREQQKRELESWYATNNVKVHQ
jgi:hypothetical protein